MGVILERIRLPTMVMAALLTFASTVAQAEPPTTVVTITSASGQAHDFLLEVADTEAQRQRGLMFREELPADGPGRGAQGLADADLLGALLRGEGGHSEKPETGDEYG